MKARVNVFDGIDEKVSGDMMTFRRAVIVKETKRRT